MLFSFAVVGGIGLAGDDEHFSNTDMGDLGGGDGSVGGGGANLAGVPAAGGNDAFDAERAVRRIERRGLPVAVDPDFEPGGSRRQAAGDADSSGGGGVALDDLVIER